MSEDDSLEWVTEKLQDLAGDQDAEIQRIFEELYEWMIEAGKNPRRKMGLTQATAENYIKRLDNLVRFQIKYLEPEDWTVLRDDQADDLLLMIDRGEITKRNGEEYGESAKRKFADALQKYFEWRYHEGSKDEEWEPKINFSDGSGESAYRFTHRELGLLFEAAESYGSLPSYYDTPEDEREKINGLVAQRLGIPKEEVTHDDWIHADWSRKVSSLVKTSHDAGLAPVEVEHAELHWYDPETQTFNIPTEYACKDREKERVAVADDTAESLGEWLQERRHLEKYDGSRKIWLNREGNPYQSGSLCELIRNLCDEAGIKTEGRRIVWYSLRKTMGLYVNDEGELSEANDQLRHGRLETTQEEYNRTPIEKLEMRVNDIHDEAEKAAADPEYNPYEEYGDGEISDSDGIDSTTEIDQSSNADDVVTETDPGDLHVDATIQNTTEAKVDITRKILDTINDE